MSRAGRKKRAGKQVSHAKKSPYESRKSRRPVDYDQVWAYDQAEEQARWDEAQLEARDVSADRFEREQAEPC